MGLSQRIVQVFPKVYCIPCQLVETTSSLFKAIFDAADLVTLKHTTFKHVYFKMLHNINKYE